MIIPSASTTSIFSQAPAFLTCAVAFAASAFASVTSAVASVVPTLPPFASAAFLPLPSVGTATISTHPSGSVVVTTATATTANAAVGSQTIQGPRKLPVSPIDRLSDNILARIIGLSRSVAVPVAVSIEQDREQAYYAPRHVSKRWRSVVVNSPVLWTSFALPSSYCARFLALSGSLPLDISIGHHMQRRRLTILDLSPIIGRLRSITFIQSHALRDADLQKFAWLNRPMPSLESFAIHVHAQGPEAVGRADRTFNEGGQGGLGSLTGAAPRLKELSMSRAYVPFNLHGLVRLHLSRIHFVVTSMRQLFITIVNSPALEELTFEDISLPPDQMQHLNISVVPLARLERLVIHDSGFWLTSHILARLTTSPSAHLDIRVFAPHEVGLRSIIPENVARLANVKALREARVFAMEHTFNSRTMSVHIEGHAYVSEGGGSLRVIIDCAKQTTVLYDIFANLNLLLPARLDALFLQSWENEVWQMQPSSSDLATVLYPFKHLRELTLAYCHRFLVESLILSKRQQNCPRLHRLRVLGEVGEPQVIPVARSRSIAIKFPRLQTIEIGRCWAITDDTVRRLAELVDNVTLIDE
ncbi:hypothetical protein BOTBODRAFT_33073 [Botryobasidium botryosum FD-172 SS1]|uniref:F-box domain-containing protein n=1 Tax=Botryobasidium botryosum (strain FD-172 SS1) TaxID=930990 RepID=A0A067MDX3_BOTB1|nr:hypothetical protein BOTBODRAFT_33073 [Botryobasidium botryosum FD-172 SS1]